MFESVHGSFVSNEDLVRDIAARVEKIKSLAANSDIGGETEGHEISHQCRLILSRISGLQ
jgi:hypothetical protein